VYPSSVVFDEDLAEPMVAKSLCRSCFGVVLASTDLLSARIAASAGRRHRSADEPADASCGGWLGADGIGVCSGTGERAASDD
jgi:hypothetical protein